MLELIPDAVIAAVASAVGFQGQSGYAILSPYGVRDPQQSCVRAIGLASGLQRVGQKIEPILAPKHLAVEHIAW
jgi:hypothetical protein